jgi:hypothetical protein
MSIKFPSIDEVRAYLEPLGHADIQAMSRESGVAFTTIWNIRNGLTSNPGMETVRRFYPPKAKAKQTAKA